MHFVFILANFVFLIAGISFIAVGNAQINKVSMIDELKDDIWADYFLITVGSILLLTACIGCFSAITESRIMYFIYGCILLVVHLAQMALAAVSFLDTIKKKEYTEGKLEDIFQDYHKNETSRLVVDGIQKNWRCCALYNIKEWKKHPPNSCCSTLPCKNENAYKEDCKKSAYRVLLTPMRTISILAVFIGVVEFYLALWAWFVSKRKEPLV